jgi:hypothetical protein
MSCTGRRIATLAMTYDYRFVAADRGGPTVSMTWPLPVDAALWRQMPMAVR